MMTSLDESSNASSSSKIKIEDYARQHHLDVDVVLSVLSLHFEEELTRFHIMKKNNLDFFFNQTDCDPIMKIGSLLDDVQNLQYVNVDDLCRSFEELKYSCEKIRNCKTQNNLVKIAVAGLHSAGKSTFINSLLDQIEQVEERGPNYKKIIGKLAPSGAAPTTRTITSFVYSESPYFVDSKKKKYTLEEYQSTAVDQNFKGRFEVGVKNPLLEGIELMDVPGLFVDEKDDETVKSVLDEVDVLFWLVNIADGTIKDNALQGLKAFNKPIVIIVTQVQNKDKSGFEKVYEEIKTLARKKKLYVSGWNWFSADNLKFLKPSIRPIVEGKKEELKKFIQKKALEGGNVKQRQDVLKDSLEKSKKKYQEKLDELKSRLDRTKLDLQLRICDERKRVSIGINNKLKLFFGELLTEKFSYRPVIEDEKKKEHLFIRDDYGLSVTPKSWDWKKLIEQDENLNSEIRCILRPYTKQKVDYFSYDASLLKFHPFLWALQNKKIEYSWGSFWGGGYAEAMDSMEEEIRDYMKSIESVMSEYMSKQVIDFLNEEKFCNDRLEDLLGLLKTLTDIYGKIADMSKLLNNLEN